MILVHEKSPFERMYLEQTRTGSTYWAKLGLDGDVPCWIRLTRAEALEFMLDDLRGEVEP